MTDFNTGDAVRVAMPRGVNKRGIPGISVLYTTWPEARFDGAVGTIVEIDPRSKFGIPLYLVDFSHSRLGWQFHGSGNGFGQSGSSRPRTCRDREKVGRGGEGDGEYSRS